MKLIVRACLPLLGIGLALSACGRDFEATPCLPVNKCY